ncbi:organic cation transporter protein-like isoform X2 [Bacillus rossius redtenbacheri]|uniref:organic cation transporter protein-like isoform X2 n=1 Tax=Bacillus rossius redtenbacheri TaxID=93214 RepID=UPI002FDD7B76
MSPVTSPAAHRPASREPASNSSRRASPPIQILQAPQRCQSCPDPADFDSREKFAPLLGAAAAAAAAAAPMDGGLWQLRGALLVSLVKVPSAWFMASILFIAPAPEPGGFWCARPPAFRHWGGKQWLSAAHPPHARLQGRRDPCLTYDLTTGEWDTPNRSVAFSNLSAVPCARFEFRESPEAPFSIVRQWHLVCQKDVLVGVSQLFYLLGMLSGGIVCSAMLSRFSPKRILLAGMLVQLVSGVSTAYAPFFELHLALRFTSAIAFVHLISCGYIICTDITGGSWRTVVGACYESMWSVGVITLPGLSSLFLDWRDLQVTISLPTILLLLLYRWMPDSPRWLLAHGYADKAQEILKEAALFNGQDIPAMETPEKTIQRQAASAGWTSLLRPPNSRLTVCCLHVLWAATVVCYYGGLLNAKNLGDKVAANTVVAGVAEMVGMLLAIWLLWRDRKWTIVGLLLLVGSAAALLSWTLPLNAPWTRDGALVVLAMIHRVPIACSLNVLQVASPQIFDPEFRAVATLSSVTFARLFLLSAPFIASTAGIYGEYTSLSIFGAITVAGGLAGLLLQYACKRQAECKGNFPVSELDKGTNWARRVSLHSISAPTDVEKKTETNTRSVTTSKTSECKNNTAKSS